MRVIISFLLALFISEIPAACVDEPVVKRVPWTNSKISGSPELPAPFSSVRVLPKLTFKDPTELAFVPGSKLAIVVERGGSIYSFPTDRAADSPSLVTNLRDMTGPGTDAFSITFHPDFISNRFVYVTYFCPTNKAMRAARFTLGNEESPKIDLASHLLVVDWVANGHRGGALKFGPDGFLYVSTGDGGTPAPPDPNKTGQDISDLLSSILRVDVDHPENGKNYRVPPGNPFVKTANARPEVWAYGMRNPWKMSFDYRDGALWVGDVGWETWEMIFRIDHAGFNGGWSAMEGPLAVNTAWPRGPTPIEMPVSYYPHTEGASVTGGFIYHGKRFPRLRDSYIHGDWDTGTIWELRFEKGVVTGRNEIAHSPARIICFSEDNEHEIWFMDYAGGGIHQLVPTENVSTAKNFPRKLSETGLFSSTSNYQFSPGVVPYSIVAPSWNDFAKKDFAVAVPGESQITGVAAGNFTFPSNSVMVRTFSMEMIRSDAASRRRLETQLLHFDGHGWNGYTYRWNEAQTDGDLVEKSGAEMSLVIKDADAPGGQREQTWRFHSRSECSRCHINSRGFINAFIPEQLAKTTGTNLEAQFDLLTRIGLLETKKPRAKNFTLADPQDESAPLELRARSWLHGNCGHCHRPDAGGAVVMYLHGGTALEKTLTVGHAPTRGTFGITNAEIIAAGEPFRSALLYRTLTTSAGRMPIVGSSFVDESGVKLLRDWIKSLAPGKFSLTEDKVSRALLNKDEQQLSELLETTSGAMELDFAAADKNFPDRLRQQFVTQASGHAQPVTRDLFERFLPANQRRKTLGANVEPEIIFARYGDIIAGRKIFFAQGGAQCGNCHRVAGEGRDFGPDLSRIATKHKTREALLEQILHPNKVVEQPWQAHTIEMKNGEIFSGIIESKSVRELDLKIADGSVVKIETAKILSDQPQKLSLMPEGLLQNLTAQEAADLIAFLASLR